MKRKSRSLRSLSAGGSQAAAKAKKRADTGKGKKTSGPRRRGRRSTPALSDGCDTTEAERSADANYNPTAADHAQTHREGRLAAAVCRLCHGKFSPRSLRHAFHSWPQDPTEAVSGSDTVTQSQFLFHTDFQRLVGVQLDRDPRLSEFVCKKCHAKFYKCHSILLKFLQRVNIPAMGKRAFKLQMSAKCQESTTNYSLGTYFTSDSQCLHNLVSWAHQHGEVCHSCPDLKEVLEGQCWGSVRAVWGCIEGHTHIMETQAGAPSQPDHMESFYSEAPGNGSGDEEERADYPEDDEKQEWGENGTGWSAGGDAQNHGSQPEDMLLTEYSGQDEWRDDGENCADQEMAMSLVHMENQTPDSDLSDRIGFDEEFEENRKGSPSDEKMFEPFSEKRVGTPNKRRQSSKLTKEPKVRKKPGPKPGWKNKFKPKGEELPNIYKCPYQGCTAVYRAPDGLKKHIREHHEDMRERPCPHPGCNKVFMIDRYLQRHVKLIHTEERNYICDQCGQTFKQRKHLSVHQMRHSGAKPLQCEVCGFQCRQRASLKYHMTKHKAEADLEFECFMCRKRFEKAHNLNVHMSMVHPLTQADGQRGGGQQQYADLHTITLTGELVQQDRDR